MVICGALVNTFLCLLPRKRWVYILFSALFSGAVSGFAYYSNLLTPHEAMMTIIPVSMGIGFWINKLEKDKKAQRFNNIRAASARNHHLKFQNKNLFIFLAIKKSFFLLSIIEMNLFFFL